MTLISSVASGKIILTGEYAVVFGYPGIATPVSCATIISYTNSKEPLTITFRGIKPTERGEEYVRRVVELCEKEARKTFGGSLIIDNSIPLGKGMGSSTALVISVCRTLLGTDCEEAAKRIEDTVNPGNSGLDFAVIWRNEPVFFKKSTDPKSITLPNDLLTGAVLIDSGTPGETTPELVAWMKTREAEVHDALAQIGSCTERLAADGDLATIVREHHQAQLKLGVVTPRAGSLIANIQAAGGAAKVLGAGARTGGGGMILALGCDPKVIARISAEALFPCFPL